MSENKHTGGAWIASTFQGVREVSTDGPRRLDTISAGTPTICTVHEHSSWENYSAAKAQALITAAPDLLEASKDWLRFAEETLGEFDVEPCDGGEPLCRRCEASGCINLKIRNTRAAITKAQQGADT